MFMHSSPSVVTVKPKEQRSEGKPADTTQGREQHLHLQTVWIKVCLLFTVNPKKRRELNISKR